ncbi:hypothetical protein D9M70_581460 [compost metagenome]
MQKHASLSFVAQRSQPVHLLAIEVQLGRVSDAQHHRKLPGPSSGALPMRLHHVAPIDLLVAEKPIRRNGLRPVIACAGNTRRRQRRKPLEQFLGPPIPPRITKIQTVKFLVHPCSRLVAHCRPKIRE